MTNTYRAVTHSFIICALLIVLVPSAMAQGLTASATMLLPTRYSVPAELKAVRGRILAIMREASRSPGAGDHRVTLRTTLAAPSPSSIADEMEDFVAMGSGRALILAASVGEAHQRQGIKRSAFILDPGGAWRLLPSFPALPVTLSAIGSDEGQLVLWDRYYRRVLWVPETQLR